MTKFVLIAVFFLFAASEFYNSLGSKEDYGKHLLLCIVHLTMIYIVASSKI